MKTINKLLLVCLMMFLGVLFCGLCREVNAYSYYEINVEMGFDNRAKYGRYIPVSIDIFSQEDFEGTISLQRVAPDGSTQINTYPVKIDGPDNVNVSIIFPLFDRNNEFEFVLKDLSGDEVKTKKTTLEVLNGDYTELFVGVVDADGKAKKLFDEINLGEYSNTSFPYVMTRALSLEPEQIQGNFEYTLDCLDIIVVAESAISMLTNENAECLLEWAAAGNTLIIEYSKELEQPFLDLYTIAFEKRQIGDEILRPGLWVLSEDYGEGQIGFLTSFMDGSSFLAFAITNPELIGMLLCKNCSPELINEIISYDLNYEKEDDSYSVQYMLNAAVGKDVPNIKRYIAVIVVYIILVGPVLYFLLRKKDRAKYMLIMVLLVASVFSYGIYKMGKNTRFTDMFLQYANVINISTTEVNEKTYVCANVPYKDTYYMRIPNDYTIMALTDKQDDVLEDIVALENEESVEVLYSDADTKLILDNKVPFSRIYLEAENKHDDVSNWQIDVDITCYDGIFSGLVSNKSDKDYQQLAIILYGKIMLLGELKAGESISLDSARIVMLPYYSKDAANRIVGLDESENVNINNEAYYEELNGKAGIAEYVINKYFNEKNTNAVLVGFTDDREGTFRFDDRYETFGFTMIYKEVDINTKIGKLNYEPFNYLDIVNPDSNSTYDAYSNTTYSSWTRLQYKFDSIDTIVRVIFDLGKGMEEDNYYGTFSGVTYFYNHMTQVYDEIDISKEYFYLSELTDYLAETDEGYVLTVQYNVNTTGQYRYAEVKLPDIAVVRRDVYVENTGP